MSNISLITRSTVVSLLTLIAVQAASFTLAAENETTTSAVLEQSDDAEARVSTDLIYTKPRQTEEIKRLRALYQDQTELYTTLERDFYVKKAQFQKFQTLQSLEEAVKSSREVMLARTDVLITYFELLRAALSDTEGVELSDRQLVIDQMVGYINDLKSHRQSILATNDREQVALRANEFAKLSTPFETTAYRTLALIRIGDIQTVYDKSLIIYRDVKAYHNANPTSPLNQSERERAYKEVDNAIDKVGKDLLEVRKKYNSESEMSRSVYTSSFAGSLYTAYSGTSQIVGFLKELFVELT